MSDKSEKPAKDTPQDSKKPRKREGRADQVIVRNLISHTVLRRMVVVTLISVLSALAALAATYQVIKIKTPPQYVQLTQDGRILPVLPLTSPNVEKGEMLRFALDSVKWINTYDYINWRDQLQSNSSRFSPSGWDGFIKAFMESDNLNAVRGRYMVVSSRPSGPPSISKEGVATQVGQYTWLVKVPVEIRYQAPPSSGINQLNTQIGVVSLYISRVPLEVSQRGYAIQVYQFDTTDRLGAPKAGAEPVPEG